VRHKGLRVSVLSKNLTTMQTMEFLWGETLYCNVCSLHCNDAVLYLSP